MYKATKKEAAAKDRPTCFSPYALPLSARLFVVELTLQEGRVGQGLIHNLFFAEPRSFSDLGDAILKMDHMMDELRCPQADTERRSFCSAKRVRGKRTREERMRDEQAGKTFVQHRHSDIFTRRLAGASAFYINVIYRQHSSWQGEVTWPETGQKKSFRSALELMYLIMSALVPGQGADFDRA